MAVTEPSAALSDERAVMICPQCEGEGSYADGLDEAACSTECTRCGSNGWIVDLAALSASIPETAPEDHTDVLARRMGAKFVPHDYDAALTPTAQGEVVQADDPHAFRIANMHIPAIGAAFANVQDRIAAVKRLEADILKLRDHRLTFSHSGEVGRLREALSYVRMKAGFARMIHEEDNGVDEALAEIIRTTNAALSTPEAVSLKGDRV